MDFLGKNKTHEVKAICNADWTTTVKNAWKAHLIATKPSEGL